MATYPPEPTGDVAQLRNSITQLRDLQRLVGEAIVRPTNRWNSYDWDLGKTGKKVESKIEDARDLGERAKTDLAKMIALLEAECVRVASAKEAWRSRCAAIRAAETD